jgi:polar amino acid transport system substrate-binding protein
VRALSPKTQDPWIVRLVADPYPPYQFELAGRVVGCDYELVVGAFESAGLLTTVRLLPWHACLAEIGHGRADGIFQIVRTPERDGQLRFSRPFRIARTLVYQRRGTFDRFASLADLESAAAAHPVGVLRGFSYDPLIDRLAARARIEVDTHEDLIRGLADASFDLALLDVGVATQLIGALGVDRIESVPGVEIARELCLAVRPPLQQVLEAFESGLDELRERGRDREILRKHGLEPEKTRSVEAPIGSAAGG